MTRFENIFYLYHDVTGIGTCDQGAENPNSQFAALLTLYILPVLSGLGAYLAIYCKVDKQTHVSLYVF